jgi:hypothetical protein
MLANLAKAGVATVLAPVAVVVDVVSMPFADVGDYNKPMFDKTGKLLSAAGEAVKEAVKVER